MFEEKIAALNKANELRMEHMASPGRQTSLYWL